MSVHQKLGINLESKVVQKLSLEKKVSTKKWSPKLMFLDIFFLIRLIFDIQNWLNRNSSKFFFSLLLNFLWVCWFLAKNLAN